MAEGLFVTGTDTGVGKTLVACALGAVLRQRGERVAAFKPAETGCEPGAAGLVATDAERLRAACGSDQSDDEVCPLRFRAPAAPLAAAEAEGGAIDLDVLVAHHRALARRFERVLVEGAGGLLVPLAPGATYADLAAALGLPVVLVVGSKLGCLNHALLSLEVLEARGIPVAGWVLNELSPEPSERLAHQTHRALLRRFTKQRDLGHFPYLAPEARSDWDELGRTAAAHLDLAV